MEAREAPLAIVLLSERRLLGGGMRTIVGVLPRDIRKLIGRMVETSELAGIQTRATVARVARRGRGEVSIEATEYWLEALLVVMRSDAPNAARRTW